MSIFNQNTIEESGDWAVDQSYNASTHPCAVCGGPSCITRKDDGHPFYTAYELWNQYRYACSRIDRLESLITNVSNGVCRKHNRGKFIQFIRTNCPDDKKVLYKHNYYYNWDWFKAEFTYDIYNHYFDI